MEMTIEQIKAQIKSHPKIAVAVGGVCVVIFVFIVFHKSGSASTGNSAANSDDTATVDPVTATTTAANTDDTDASLQASLAATQEQGSVALAESANSLAATKDTNAANVRIAGIQYGDAKDVSLDQDKTQVLLGGQNLELGKLQSNNTLAAAQAADNASVTINAQNNATTQQAQTYAHDLGTQQITLATLAQNQNTQLSQQREADNYHLSQDQLSAGLVSQALQNENAAFGDLNETHQKNRYNAQQQNIQNTLASYKAQ